MSFQISWTIEGEKQLSRVLNGIKTSLTDFRKPLNTISRNLIRTFSNDVFSTRGGAINERWQDLSPRTLASKAMRGYPSDPLIATGKMKRGFRSIVSSTQAVIENEATYFKYHQSKAPRRKIPRRVMMKLANNQKTMIVREFQQYLLNAARSA